MKNITKMKRIHTLPKELYSKIMDFLDLDSVLMIHKPSVYHRTKWVNEEILKIKDVGSLLNNYEQYWSYCRSEDSEEWLLNNIESSWLYPE